MAKILFFFKYNNTTMAEAHAQLFFFTQIKANPNSTIRIPEISHAWEKPGGLVYIVLEHIDIEHFASDEQRSQAITELISSNHRLGGLEALVGSVFDTRSPTTEKLTLSPVGN
ncbi:hypothetical protein I7I53_09450 [Histoplasma capsulatum var. duboisii H88]|uniref:Uncharacterized protein n=1 Tax=Ajellomyces capsulatus (strain H88) TaxID=544711 RepID=A0A8A1L5D5_AJEC8|nr:hypothetical protein I7I53_09450 [Histoplasma capsulatum var. duboisii H88]